MSVLILLENSLYKGIIIFISTVIIPHIFINRRIKLAILVNIDINGANTGTAALSAAAPALIKSSSQPVPGKCAPANFKLYANNAA